MNTRFRIALQFAMAFAFLITGSNLVMAESTKSPEEIYIGLRAQVFAVTPADLGISLKEGEASVYGIVMEIGYPEATATLISFSTGDASLYFSKGGGIIGGGQHESVRATAKAFVVSAGTQLANLQETQDLTSPSVGRVRFFAMTPQGVFSAEAGEDELGNKKHALSPLFYAGQEVLTSLRLITEKPN